MNWIRKSNAEAPAVIPSRLTTRKHYQFRPATLQALKLRHAVLDQLFFSLCESLSKEQGLPGAFKGTNEQGTFVPRPYEQQQTEWIETFFRNNGFIGKLPLALLNAWGTFHSQVRKG